MIVSFTSTAQRLCVDCDKAEGTSPVHACLQLALQIKQILGRATGFGAVGGDVTIECSLGFSVSSAAAASSSALAPLVVVAAASSSALAPLVAMTAAFSYPPPPAAAAAVASSFPPPAAAAAAVAIAAAASASSSPASASFSATAAASAVAGALTALPASSGWSRVMFPLTADYMGVDGC